MTTALAIIPKRCVCGYLLRAPSVGRNCLHCDIRLWTFWYFAERKHIAEGEE